MRNHSLAATTCRSCTSWGAIALLSLIAAGCSDRSSNNPGAAAPAIPVVVAAAAIRDVPLTIDSPGTLKAINSVAVRPRVDGEIMAVEFQEGTEVHAGQVLFRLDARPLEAALAQARAQLAKDEATLARNRSQAVRYDDLAPKGYVSADDLAQVQANLGIAEGAVAADKAAIAAASLNLDYATIRAPITGRTGVIAFRKGSLVKAADNLSLVTVTQMDPLLVDFSVPQRNLDAINRRLKEATVTITSGRDLTTAPGHAGQLEFINNTIDPATGAILLRARVPNTDRSLWPGQFVHVQLEVGGSPPALTVPSTAIGNGPDGNFVFVVDATGHARQRSVTLGRQVATFAIVSAGIAAGDRVVIDGQSRLRDGSPVKIVTASPGA